MRLQFKPGQIWRRLRARAAASAFLCKGSKRAQKAVSFFYCIGLQREARGEYSLQSRSRRADFCKRSILGVTDENRHIYWEYPVKKNLPINILFKKNIFIFEPDWDKYHF
ncbi:MAG: hypothetical protein ACR2K1_11870 [Saprospiraceae bacterium]